MVPHSLLLPDKQDLQAEHLFKLFLWMTQVNKQLHVMYILNRIQEAVMPSAPLLDSCCLCKELKR